MDERKDWIEVTKGISAAKKRQHEGDILVALHKKHDKHNGRTYCQLNIRLSQEVCQRMRWLDGDNVQLLYSPDKRYGWIKRTKDPQVGLTLKRRTKRPTNQYQMLDMRVSATGEVIAAFFPNGSEEPYVPQDIEVHNEGVMFLLGKYTEAK